MKTFYALEVRFMNGTVTMDSEITLYETEELANKTKLAVEHRNKDASFPSVLCLIKKVNLFENENEVPILNKFSRL